MGHMVTISQVEYDNLRAAAEELSDLRAYDQAMASLASGEDELIPAAFADRLTDGENAIRVYRDFRGMTQAQLAEASGVNRVYISQIEGGKKPGSMSALKLIASALKVDLDDLA